VKAIPHHTVQDRKEPASATDIAHPGIAAAETELFAGLEITNHA
jgi:hypothetical protein